MAEKDRSGRADLIVYADYVCPYCYLAEVALAPLRVEGAVVNAQPFELWPAPHPLPDLRKPYFVEGWERQVLPLARAFGAEAMQRPVVAARTRKAHEAAMFAREQGAGDEMHAAIYRAYFEEARDIGRIDVLVDVGAAVGLNRSELKVALDIDKYTDLVAAAVARAFELRIAAVPAYVVPGVDDAPRIVTGVRSTDELRALVHRTTTGVNGARE